MSLAFLRWISVVCDVKSNKYSISEVLRILATKGTYETLLYVRNNEEVGYSAILQYVMNNKIVASRASMHKTITKLMDIGLLERRIMQDLPFRTGYKISERGFKVIEYLNGIKHATE